MARTWWIEIDTAAEPSWSIEALIALVVTSTGVSVVVDLAAAARAVASRSRLM
jgi:hypothetical protein